MENVGQTICGAGPLFLRMVLAVILAVTVYSKPGLGPGPDPFGLAWGARVLGRTLLVWLGGPGSWAGQAYTINRFDSDEDVNLIRLRDLTVIRMLI